MTAALVVIDPQHDFVPLLAPGTGGPALQRCRALLRAARSAGVAVVVTQEAHRAEHVDFGRELEGDEPVHCVEGTPGVELLDGLAPQPPGEWLIVKRRYSAFFATDLDLLLRGLGVDTVVLCGVLTDVCVHYTAADAHQLDYRVHVVGEACAGSSVAAHAAALDAIEYLQRGAVVSVEEAVGRMSSSETGGRAPMTAG